MEKSMKFDYAILDLDYTLFDTRKLENDMWDIFTSQGVSRQDYEETYRQSLCTISREEFDYDFQEQVDFLRGRGYELGWDVVENLNNLLNNNYLFPDSIEFVKFLKTISAKVVLLTAGDEEFQKKKVDRSNIRQLFDEVVVLNGHKDDYLRPIVEKGFKILFVNDSWRENIHLRKEFNNLFMVGIDGPHGRKDNDGELEGLKYVPTLTDAKKYVAEIK
jgi:phosphoserine phosphatase